MSKIAMKVKLGIFQGWNNKLRGERHPWLPVDCEYHHHHQMQRKFACEIDVAGQEIWLCQSSYLQMGPLSTISPLEFY